MADDFVYDPTDPAAQIARMRARYAPAPADPLLEPPRPLEEGIDARLPAWARPVSHAVSGFADRAGSLVDLLKGVVTHPLGTAQAAVKPILDPARQGDVGGALKAAAGFLPVAGPLIEDFPKGQYAHGVGGAAFDVATGGLLKMLHGGAAEAPSSGGLISDLNRPTVRPAPKPPSYVGTPTTTETARPMGAPTAPLPPGNQFAMPAPAPRPLPYAGTPSSTDFSAPGQPLAPLPTSGPFSAPAPPRTGPPPPTPTPYKAPLGPAPPKPIYIHGQLAGYERWVDGNPVYELNNRMTVPEPVPPQAAAAPAAPPPAPSSTVPAPLQATIAPPVAPAPPPAPEVVAPAAPPTAVAPPEPPPPPVVPKGGPVTPPEVVRRDLAAYTAPSGEPTEGFLRAKANGAGKAAAPPAPKADYEYLPGKGPVQPISPKLPVAQSAPNSVQPVVLPDLKPAATSGGAPAVLAAIQDVDLAALRKRFAYPPKAVPTKEAFAERYVKGLYKGNEFADPDRKLPPVPMTVQPPAAATAQVAPATPEAPLPVRPSRSPAAPTANAPNAAEAQARLQGGFAALKEQMGNLPIPADAADATTVLGQFKNLDARMRGLVRKHAATYGPEATQAWLEAEHPREAATFARESAREGKVQAAAKAAGVTVSPTELQSALYGKGAAPGSALEALIAKMKAEGSGAGGFAKPQVAGAVALGATGAVAGSLTDKEHPIRGAIEGAGLAALLGMGASHLYGKAPGDISRARGVSGGPIFTDYPAYRTFRNAIASGAREDSLTGAAQIRQRAMDVGLEQPNRKQWLNRYADNLARRPGPQNAAQFAGFKGDLANAVNAAAYTLPIGWNIKSAMRVPSQALMALRDPDITPWGLAKNAVAQYTAEGRAGLARRGALLQPRQNPIDYQLGEGGGLTKLLNRASDAIPQALQPMEPIRQTHNFARGMVNKTKYDALRAQGLGNATAAEAADRITNESQGGYTEADVNPYWTGPGGRFLRPYAKFPQTVAENLLAMGRDVKGGMGLGPHGWEGRNWRQIQGPATYAATMAAGLYGTKKLLGLNPRDYLFHAANIVDNGFHPIMLSAAQDVINHARGVLDPNEAPDHPVLPGTLEEATRADLVPTGLKALIARSRDFAGLTPRTAGGDFINPTRHGYYDPVNAATVGDTTIQAMRSRYQHPEAAQANVRTPLHQYLESFGLPPTVVTTDAQAALAQVREETAGNRRLNAAHRAEFPSIASMRRHYALPPEPQP